MKTISAAIFSACVLLGTVQAADSITPAMQAAIDRQQKVIAAWAAKPALVEAVKVQNKKGPLPGMDNAKWAALKPDAPVVIAFEKCPAGKWLARKVRATHGIFCEAFLNGTKGEKVAFAAKPTSYIHAGQPKFDVPMKGRAWQGEPAHDISSNTYAVQISTPVLDDGKPIGVLVASIAMEKLPAK